MKSLSNLLLIILFALAVSCKKEPVQDQPEKLSSDSFFIHFGGPASFSSDMATDADDNLYVTGNIQSSPGNLAAFGTAMYPLHGDKDIYLAKYDKYGNVIWAKTIGTASEETSEAIAVDKDGNSYIAGYFRDSTKLDGVSLKVKPLKLWGSSDNMLDMFIAKYDKTGKQLWAKAVAGSGYERPTAIVVDNNGKFYITGYYVESIYFGSNVYRTNASAMFVASYTADGEVNWARSVGMEYSIYPSAINLNTAGELVISGSFSGPHDFGGAVLNPVTGGQSLFTVKYSNTGSVVWAKGFYADADNNANNIGYTQTLDNNNNIYIAGACRGVLHMGSIAVGQNGKSNALLAKLDNNGNVNWATGISSVSEVAILNVKYSNNKLYTAGYTTSPATFGDTTVNAGNGIEGFAARYSQDGKYEKVEKFDTRGGYPERLTTDNAGNTTLFGTFSAPIIYNKTPVSPTTARELFLYKLKL